MTTTAVRQPWRRTLMPASYSEYPLTLVCYLLKCVSDVLNSGLNVCFLTSFKVVLKPNSQGAAFVHWMDQNHPGLPAISLYLLYRQRIGSDSRVSLWMTCNKTWEPSVFPSLFKKLKF